VIDFKNMKLCKRVELKWLWPQNGYLSCRPFDVETRSETEFRFVSTIPPLSYTHMHLNTTLIWRTSGRIMALSDVGDPGTE